MCRRSQVLLLDFADSIVSNRHHSKPGGGRAGCDRERLVMVRVRILTGNPPLDGEESAANGRLDESGFARAESSVAITQQRVQLAPPR